MPYFNSISLSYFILYIQYLILTVKYLNICLTINLSFSSIYKGVKVSIAVAEKLKMRESIM